MKSTSSSKRKPYCGEIRVRPPRDYPWKVLGSVVNDLSDSLASSDKKEVCDIIRKRDIAAYLKLQETWGPQSTIPSGASSDTIFSKYQVASLLKKFQFPGDSKSRREEAKKKFLAAEEVCRTFNHVSSKDLAYLPEDWTLDAYSYARGFLEKVLGSELPPREHLTEWSRHGPGSNLDTIEGKVSAYDKYENWPYSCTKDAAPLARLSIMDDERWLGALENSYRQKYGIEPWRILDQDTFWSTVIKIVPGNRIAFVPKNSLTDRSIAIEPCMNLYLQLGVDGYIRRRLKRWDIDLDNQYKNQELARLGSLTGDSPESFVTLDLAAASDTVSLRVCELLLPSPWYRYLMLLRSPCGSLDGDTIHYEKMSSMGNGFTFALESAIFASVIYGATRAVQGNFNKACFAVYGDDLIVQRRLAFVTIAMLNLCGFTINPDKSFLHGYFRESCGADWLKGAPVRPIFLTQTPSTVFEVWNDFNRLQRLLYLRRYTFASESCSTIAKWIPPSLLGIKGPISDEAFDSYQHSFLPISGFKRGWWEFEIFSVSRESSKRAGDFFMRKLMHPLRYSPESPFLSRRDFYFGKRLERAGSRFTVYDSNVVTVGKTLCRTSYWCDEYVERLL